MIHIKAPEQILQTNQFKLFLAGSIEMGTAESWQNYVAERLEKSDIILLNPRRDEWNSNWEQKKDNPNFRAQVEWELNALDASSHILFYFDKDTKSPITLLELGLYAKSGKISVVCPEGFWRKGNVDIVCDKNGIKQFTSIDDFIDSMVI